MTISVHSIYKKCHWKSYHIDVNYHTTLIIIFRVVTNDPVKFEKEPVELKDLGELPNIVEEFRE
jgi:hypothetical protein